MPTRFVDLPAYLTSLLESPSISANGLRQLHRSLEETWERVSVDSFWPGIPIGASAQAKLPVSYFSTGHGGFAEGESKIWSKSA